MEIFLALIVIIFTTAGQMLLKKAAEKKGLWNFFLWSGYFLFLLTVFLSFHLMKIIELKYFTAIMSMSYLSVMFGSYLFFNETIDKYKIAGTALVICGIMVFCGDFFIPESE